jgi:hypothetical protein
VERLAKWKEPLLIFAHNGGKFDFFYFLDYLPAGDMRIINGRIIKARLGNHELRDSYAIMPFPLAAYQKDSIDYDKLHKSRREKHKQEIIDYLRGDCVYLHELVTAFFDEFGDKLTIGSSSMKQLQRFHTFTRGSEQFDESFRTDFYFGGRNQCFKSGLIKKHVKIYDVNSMYPHVMRSYLHPVGTKPILSTRIESNTCFVVTTGHNFGAFPVRTKEGGLDFTVPYGKFSTTIHEWNAALETGSFKPVTIHKTYGFNDRVSFGDFVDHFYYARAKAKASGDIMHTLFYKFVLNSAYGKFAQNPANFFEWCIEPWENPLLTEKCPRCPKNTVDPVCTYCQGSGFRWSPAFEHQGKYRIWQAPLLQHFYYNVCTGASITGAARAELLRGIKCATNPLYCDTDSIICEELDGVHLHDTQLGAWKLEDEGELAAICGKKLYAIFGPKGECIKKAHKGARLTGVDILKIAGGATVESVNPVPTFKLNGAHEFSVRKIRRTA